jgi:RNA polymerase sigma-70 factor (ECF subfamily)
MTPHDLVLFLRWRYAPRFADASDAQLLDWYLAARDEPALCALVARHAGALFNLCRVELGDLDLAEDAFQETVLRLHCRGRWIRDRRAIQAWLLTTARRVCAALRQQRDRRRAAEGQAAARTPAAADDPADLLSREEQRRRVARAVGRLPDRYGVPLHLGLHGLSPGEIGRALGLPEATVKTRITRGRKLLHAKLQAEGLGAVAGVWLAERRAEAVPAGLIAAAVRAATAGKKPAVGLAAAAWWLWPGVATLVLAGAVGTGLALWPADVPVPPPDESMAEVRETDIERDLRLLRDEVTPKVIESLRPLMVFGGGEIRAVGCRAEGTRRILELEATHKWVQFKSRMRLAYQTLNAGLEIVLDQYGKGEWKQITWDRPIVFNFPGLGGERPAGRNLYDNVHDAFSVIPFRMPPIVAPSTGPEFARKVGPFLGVWCVGADRRYAVELMFIDGANERVSYVTMYGHRFELHPAALPDGTLTLQGTVPFVRVGPRLVRLDRNPIDWRERDEGGSQPP